MAVTLRLAGRGLPGAGQTKLLVSGTLSIGRGPGNDWVLPDPDRHLSKTHCVLSVENGRVVLTDVSTNGVHVNGARQATARDSRTVLTDGDDFRLGDYTVTVAEVDDARPGAAGAGAFGRSFADPFDAPGGAEEGGSPLDIDPLDDPLGRPPDPAFQHPLAHRALAPKAEDPFDMAEERARRPIDPDDDLFRGTRPAVDWQGPTQQDHADAPRHAFAAPKILPAADPSGIDFDALIGDIGPAAAPQPLPTPPAQARGRDPFGDLDNLLSPEPPPSRPVAPAPAPPPPRAAPPPPVARAADPFADLDEPPARPAPQAAAPQENPFSEPPRAAPPPPAPPPPVAAPVAAASATGNDARAALLAFLQGAGVPGAALANADPEATLRSVGEVFRAMTEGLREVLMSRAAIKGDMRVEQTMIQARNNNALKFSVTPEEAVLALLSPDRPGYMAPLNAAKEAFNDIKSHELAVMAGVQTALMQLLQRFDPATLEGRLAQGRLAAVLPGARKARYWDSFTEVYGQIAREAEDDFQSVFGRAFAKAYTAQSKRES